jgi:glycosyltransferase involved in cell wall biosynthesis
MNILYLSQYFPPEVGATQTRAIEMASYLAHAGHKVTVLTEFPNHPHGIIPSRYKGKWIEYERLHGIDVLRCRVYARPNKTFLTRMGFYISFMLASAFAGMFLRHSVDVVYATSPPFFVGLSGLLQSRLKSAKFVFEVRDLWPRSAVELGELGNMTFIRWAEWLEKTYYTRADAVIAVTRGIQSDLKQMGYNSMLVLNGTNTHVFRPIPGHKQRFGWDNKFIVMYAGILGIAQGMEQLLEVVERFKKFTDIQFVFVGEGPMKEKVEKIKADKQLDNLQLMGQIARENMAQVLSASDCCLVPLKKNPLFLGALPSKMFDCMACEKPVILSVDGEARAVLESAKAGMYVEPENSDQMEDAILWLKAHPDRAREMGRRGREFVRLYYSRLSQAKQLETFLIDIVHS